MSDFKANYSNTLIFLRSVMYIIVLDYGKFADLLQELVLVHKDLPLQANLPQVPDKDYQLGLYLALIFCCRHDGQ